MTTETRHETQYFDVVAGFDDQSVDLFVRKSVFHDEVSRKHPEFQKLGEAIGLEAFDFYRAKWPKTDMYTMSNLAMKAVISLGNEQPPLLLPESAQYLKGAELAMSRRHTEISRTIMNRYIDGGL